MEIPAANGIATARALAKVHSLVAEGSFLSSKTLAMLYKPQLIDELDVVNGYPECKGHGFQYTKNPQGSWIFGHSGLGGQNVRIDLDNKLAFAYLCNGLKAGDSDNTGTFSRLKSALYDCLDLDMG
uniref:Beta-lactamase-related domain-containing protein n=1 Tax=Plectus sambesii TaxID=2011161 RepID=A0A914UJU4_9BILA